MGYYFRFTFSLCIFVGSMNLISSRSLLLVTLSQPIKMYYLNWMIYIQIHIREEVMLLWRGTLGQLSSRALQHTPTAATTTATFNCSPNLPRPKVASPATHPRGYTLVVRSHSNLKSKAGASRVSAHPRRSISRS